VPPRAPLRGAAAGAGCATCPQQMQGAQHAHSWCRVQQHAHIRRRVRSMPTAGAACPQQVQHATAGAACPQQVQGAAACPQQAQGAQHAHSRCRVRSMPTAGARCSSMPTAAPSRTHAWVCPSWWWSFGDCSGLGALTLRRTPARSGANVICARKASFAGFRPSRDPLATLTRRSRGA
jgi:hypothetical protein